MNRHRLPEDRPEDKNFIERFFDWLTHAWQAFVSFVGEFLAPFVAIVLQILSALEGGILRILEFVFDPFRLKVYGTQNLTSRAALDILGYTVLLIFSGSFELFAWANMWGYTGIEGALLKLMPCLFAGMIVLLDRGILVMDDSGDKKIWVVPLRVSMLVLLSFITSIPVEMRVFAPEIDAVIEGREKENVDKIREAAKAYEIDRSTKQHAASEAVLTDSPEDVVKRRSEDRQELLDEQERTRQALRAEVASGATSGHGHGDGANAASIRKELDGEIAELQEFDAETEKMRLAAVQAGVETRGEQATELDETLHRVDVMDAEDLARNYGGTYKEPNGFLARFRVLLGILDEQDASARFVSRNTLIVWGCRIVMIAFGLSILFVKFVMQSAETRAYYSMKGQALSGNTDAFRTIRMLALAGDADAVDTLRMLAGDNPDAERALRKLGLGGNVEFAGWDKKIVDATQVVYDRRGELVRALVFFRANFRALCRERRTSTLGIAGVPRSELEERAEKLWTDAVQTQIHALASAEGTLANLGAVVPGWNEGDLGEPDPRQATVRLWQLPKAQLQERFGWEDPSDLPFRNAPTA